MSDGNHDENPRHQHQYDHAHPPDNMTQACFAFYCQWHDNVGFLNFVNRTADYADVVDKKGHEARLALAATEDERERERRALESPHAVQALEAFRRPFVEMLYNRDVDNYLTYVTDLLGLVFSTRPETLRSSQERKRSSSSFSSRTLPTWWMPS